MRAMTIGLSVAVTLWAAVTAQAAGDHAHTHKTGDANGHAHETRQVPKSARPSVWLTALPDGQDYTLHLGTSGFRFSPENAGRRTEAVEGHAHLYVNGVKKSRIYGAWFHLPAAWLKPGQNTVQVTLNDNTHATWAIGKTPVASALTLSRLGRPAETVRRHVDTKKAPVTVQVPAGRVVAVHLSTAKPAELHLHGFDMTGRTDGPERPALFVFRAEPAGRYPVVMHDHGDLLGRKEKALLYIEVR